MLKDVHYYDEVHPLGVKISGIGDHLKFIPSRNKKPANAAQAKHRIRSGLSEDGNIPCFLKIAAGLAFDPKSQGSQSGVAVAFRQCFCYSVRHL